jgi:tetratricopeptide (TPR) repeat protein
VGGSLDSEIRAKIIKYVAGWSEPPSVPSKAREHVVRANYLLKQGRSASLVLKEMTAAVDAAPWWAEGYYNLGLMHGDQKQFKEAMKMLQLFVDAAPTSPKAQEAQNKIFEFEIAQEEAEKIAGMAGNWAGYLVSVEGDKLGISGDGKVFTLNIINNTLEGSVQSEPYSGSHNCTIPGQFHPVTGMLNDDRNRLELEFVWNSYDTSYHCVDMFGLAANCCLMCSEVCDAVSIVSATNQRVQLSR